MSNSTKIAFLMTIYALIFASIGIFLGAAFQLDISVTLFLTLLYTGLGLLFTSVGIYRVHRAHHRAFDQKQKAQTDYSVHQERSIEVDLPYHLAFDLCLEALNTLDKQPFMMPVETVIWWTRFVTMKQIINIRETDRAAGLIEAGLRTELFKLRDFIDFGRITMRLESIDSNTVRIHIESRPRFKTVLYDLGMNLHIVNHLALYIRQHSIEETSRLQQLKAQSKIYVVDLPTTAQWETLP